MSDFPSAQRTVASFASGSTAPQRSAEWLAGYEAAREQAKGACDKVRDLAGRSIVKRQTAVLVRDFINEMKS